MLIFFLLLFAENAPQTKATDCFEAALGAINSSKSWITNLKKEEPRFANALERYQKIYKNSISSTTYNKNSPKFSEIPENINEILNEKDFKPKIRRSFFLDCELPKATACITVAAEKTSEEHLDLTVSYLGYHKKDFVIDQKTFEVIEVEKNKHLSQKNNYIAQSIGAIVSAIDEISKNHNEIKTITISAGNVINDGIKTKIKKINFKESSVSLTYTSPTIKIR